MAWPIYLYVPNIVGYLRIACNAVGFCTAFQHPGAFTALYLASFVGDYLDGRFAVWLDQKSTFGAVLDMVTDRLSTACLLVLLSHLYQRHFIFFLSLISLDIGSHWFQMYSSFLLNKTSHKEISEHDNFLMQLYYGNRAFMAYCCIGAEVLYIALFLLHDSSLGPKAHMYDHLSGRLTNETLPLGFSLSLAVGAIAGPGWAVKQVINLVQIKQAADTCIRHDLMKREGMAKTG